LGQHAPASPRAARRPTAKRGEVSPTAASVFVYLGPHWPRFAEVFGQFGPVVARWPAGATS
jgi:hypothetical protein